MKMKPFQYDAWVSSSNRLIQNLQKPQQFLIYYSKLNYIIYFAKELSFFGMGTVQRRGMIGEQL